MSVRDRLYAPNRRRLAAIALSGLLTVVLVVAALFNATRPAAPRPSPEASPDARAPLAVDAPTIAAAAPRLSGDVLIADRGNGRLIVVDRAGRIVWQFPRPGALPAGRRFAADDAFFAPDGRTIVANDEDHQVLYRISIATGAVVWTYGHYDRAGSGPGYLHTPDDAYPLADGDVITADIFNCRILEIDPAGRIARQWGRTGDCRDAPPRSYGYPNGDTPLPDGGLLITEIAGSRVVRLDRAGHVVFDVHVPVHYPSDAHLDGRGDIVVADYASPGAVVAVDERGREIWRYGPTRGPGMLDHPSLAVPLPDGTVLLNDDDRHRVLLIDPRRGVILWQYGHTGRPSAAPGYLSTPDGLDPAPPGVSW